MADRRVGPYPVDEPPLATLRAFDWSTREAALASFCAIADTEPEQIRVEGPHGGPYTFIFVIPPTLQPPDTLANLRRSRHAR